jgi:rRNA processing protein Gar1
MGSFIHDVEGEILCESINTKIPYFNAPIYLENKVRILSACMVAHFGNQELTG